MTSPFRQSMLIILWVQFKSIPAMVSSVMNSFPSIQTGTWNCSTDCALYKNKQYITINFEFAFIESPQIGVVLMELDDTILGNNVIGSANYNRTILLTSFQLQVGSSGCKSLRFTWIASSSQDIFIQMLSIFKTSAGYNYLLFLTILHTTPIQIERSQIFTNEVKYVFINQFIVTIDLVKALYKLTMLIVEWLFQRRIEKKIKLIKIIDDSKKFQDQIIENQQNSINLQPSDQNNTGELFYYGEDPINIGVVIKYPFVEQQYGGNRIPITFALGYDGKEFTCENNQL